MTIDINDPRWTAYALGEMNDKAERMELDKALEESLEIQALVEEIQSTAVWLTDELHAEPAPKLTEEQRTSIESKANPAKTWFGLRPAWAMSIAAVAVLAIASVITLKHFNSSPPPPTQIAAAIPNQPVKETTPAPESKVQERTPTQEKSSTPKDVITQTRAKSEAIRTAPEPSAPDQSVAKAAPAEAVGAMPTTPPNPPPPSVLAYGAANSALGGTVVDPSKAVLPGVIVTAVNIDTGVGSTTLTNNAGKYRFPALQPGLYKVLAELQGFNKQVMTDVKLSASNAHNVNFGMDVSGSKEVVTVTTSMANQIIETSASTGTVLAPNTVTQLPLVSNNVLDLINVMGGTIKADNPIFTNSDQTFAGVNASNINLQRDGITANEVRYSSGIVSASRVNSESVAEFKMILSPVDAELGRSAGPAVEARIAPTERPREIPPPPGWRPPYPYQPYNTEQYPLFFENEFLGATQHPLSTFSIDVDTASYSNMRRFTSRNSLPPWNSIRIEEFINYFDYDYKPPQKNDSKPFAVHFEITEAPWNTEHRLLRIGIKGREIEEGKRPNSNLVFLLDVSGSMADSNKLPLVKQSMNMLVDKLTESDRVAIVTYASDTGIRLPSTSGDQKAKLHQAIDSLQAGGGTNGASGIDLAYKVAVENFIKGGINRVILATDGDFNVGMTSHGELQNMIEAKSKTGIYLSALGFGMGNLKDNTLEMLAGKGHGNYAYIDTFHEARKVLVQQLDSTLIPIAKDVKIQVEFNPQQISSYRLIGYEDRIMAKEDFNNDKKEAGVIGAGHTVTALYELVPATLSSSKDGSPAVDPLKYQKQEKPAQPASGAISNELLTVKIRSKKPDEDKSVLFDYPIRESEATFSKASPDFKFAASVAAFGMILRHSRHIGTTNLQNVLEWAREGKGTDANGYREEFIGLVQQAMRLIH